MGLITPLVAGSREQVNAGVRLLLCQGSAISATHGVPAQGLASWSAVSFLYMHVCWCWSCKPYELMDY